MSQDESADLQQQLNLMTEAALLARQEARNTLQMLAAVLAQCGGEIVVQPRTLQELELPTCSVAIEPEHGGKAIRLILKRG